ncbi:hypothetical protein KVL12_00525 [Helicobacter pylori]|nr:hypothetical protein KVL12_00525 [Helicobacter pylori]
MFRFYPTSAKKLCPLGRKMQAQAVRLYSKLKEMKIPLVFYRVGNIHADYKEPFVLAFNV